MGLDDVMVSLETDISDNPRMAQNGKYVALYCPTSIRVNVFKMKHSKLGNYDPGFSFDFQVVWLPSSLHQRHNSKQPDWIEDAVAGYPKRDMCFITFQIVVNIPSDRNNQTTKFRHSRTNSGIATVCWHHQHQLMTRDEFSKSSNRLRGHLQFQTYHLDWLDQN